MDAATVIDSLRLRVVTVLAAFGALAAAASYVFGAPVSVAVLVPAIALVAVATVSVGVRVGAVTALLAATGFVYVQLAGVEEPLVVDFGTGSAAIDVPTLLRGAGATWLPTLLGVAALLSMWPVAWLLRNGLDASRSAEWAYQTVFEKRIAVLRAAQDAGFRVADETSPTPPASVAVDSAQPGGEGHAVEAFPLAVLRAAHDAGFRPSNDTLPSPTSSEAMLTDDSDGEAEAVRWSPQVAAFVRVSLGSNPGGKRLPWVTGKHLADMVGAELGGLRETALVKSDEGGDVLMLLPGTDDRHAHALVHRLEDEARRQFQRSLESVVLALEAPRPVTEQAKPSDLEMQLEARPLGARASSPEAGGGS